MRQTHHNLCDHAADAADLRRIWDDDLRRSMGRRQRAEFCAGGLFLSALIGWETGNSLPAAAALLAGIMALYAAIKFMIDESNTNYLLHFWDLDEARRRLAAATDRPGNWPAC